MKNIIEVKDLTIDFEIRNGSFRAVDKISFDIKNNKTLALVGESGSGKSVTAMSLMQLLPMPQASFSKESSEELYLSILYQCMSLDFLISVLPTTGTLFSAWQAITQAPQPVHEFKSIDRLK